MGVLIGDPTEGLMLLPAPGPDLRSTRNG